MTPRLGRQATRTLLLTGGQGLQLALNLATSVVLARSLGPEDFGSLSFGLAVAAMLGLMSSLGLQSLVSREIIASPEKAGALLGTTAVLRTCSGTVLTSGVIAWAAWSSTQSMFVAAIIAVPIATAGLQSAALLFESRAEPGIPQASRLITLLAGAVTKWIAAANGWSLGHIACIYALEQIIDGIIVFCAAQRLSDSKWTFKPAYAVSLMTAGWPIALGGIAAAIHLKADQLILSATQPASELGYYAAAARLSEATYILAISAATIYYPQLSRLYDTDRPRYAERLAAGYGALFWSGCLVALLASSTAFLIIPLLYGAEYHPCIPILMIHAWACPAMFMRQLLSKGMIIERITIHSLSTHGIGAACNIALCLWLAPKAGGVGTAVASLLSYSIGTCAVTMCFASTRPHAKAMLSGILAGPVHAFRNIRKASSK